MSYEKVQLIKITNWGQRVIPGNGMRIALPKGDIAGWQMWREEAASDYEVTAVYIGNNFAVLEE